MTLLFSMHPLGIIVICRPARPGNLSFAKKRTSSHNDLTSRDDPRLWNPEGIHLWGPSLKFSFVSCLDLFLGTVEDECWAREIKCKISYITS